MYSVRRNNLTQIGLTSIFLGLVIGHGLYHRTYLCNLFILISLFHLNEFNSLAMYLPSSVNHNLFLLWNNFGSWQYWTVILVSIGECLVSVKTVNFIGNGIRFCGAGLTLTGIGLRHLSIKHLGQSFSHYITDQKQPLVTSGVYAYIRHPSYLGFYLYVLGIQMYLNNVIMTVMSVVILTAFFRKRIRFEEYQLSRLHHEYRDYVNRVGVYIPFVV